MDMARFARITIIVGIAICSLRRDIRPQWLACDPRVDRYIRLIVGERKTLELEGASDVVVSELLLLLYSP